MLLLCVIRLAGCAPPAGPTRVCRMPGECSGDNGGIAFVDGNGNAYVSGEAFSTDFPTTSGAFQTTNKGAGNFTSDVFVTKLALGAGGGPTPTPTATPTSTTRTATRPTARRTSSDAPHPIAQTGQQDPRPRRPQHRRRRGPRRPQERRQLPRQLRRQRRQLRRRLRPQRRQLPPQPRLQRRHRHRRHPRFPGHWMSNRRPRISRP